MDYIDNEQLFGKPPDDQPGDDEVISSVTPAGNGWNEMEDDGDEGDEFVPKTGDGKVKKV